MNILVDRPGTFRGKAVEHGVSESRGGFPQLSMKLSALEFYDETGTLTDTGEPGWVNWSEYDQEITGYLVLYTRKDEKWTELLNCKQVKTVYGWDGKTFEGLDGIKMDETLILYRVEPHEYNGSTTLQVTWIDKADASPTKTLAKYDTEKLKGMTSKFASVLSSSTTPTPAPAPAKAGAKPAVPPKAKPSKKAAALPSVPVEAGPAASPPAAPSTATPPPVSPAPAASAPSTPPPPAASEVTKDSAWQAVATNPLKDVPDEKIAEVWVAEGSKIGKAEEQFTGTDWATVRDAVLKATSKF
jgi:hypothetical protein